MSRLKRNVKLNITFDKHFLKHKKTQIFEKNIAGHDVRQSEAYCRSTAILCRSLSGDRHLFQSLLGQVIF